MQILNTRFVIEVNKNKYIMMEKKLKYTPAFFYGLLFKKSVLLWIIILIQIFSLHLSIFSQTDTAKTFQYLFPPKQNPIKNNKDSTKINLYQFYDMSLEELQTVRASDLPIDVLKFIDDLITISTNKEVSVRNNPNIVSVITAEEIVNSGARDLLDVLNQVPGYHFALDRNGRVGLGIRGNWANEGKVLLMVNGIELNDLYASNLYFGNDFPVDQIERIEIIRGPGSAVYGGFAELGVINIITKGVNTLSGASVSFNYGRMKHSTSRFTQSLYAGNKWNKTAFSVLVFNGIGQRSDRSNYAFYNDMDAGHTHGVGDITTLENNSDINPRFNQMFFKYKNLSITNTSQYYDVTNTDLIDLNKNRSERWGTFNNSTQIKYEKQITPKFKLVPAINAIISFPFSEEIEKKLAEENEVEGFVARFKPSLFASYDFNHRINFNGGVEYYQDYAEESHSTYFYIGDEDIVYENVGSYFQGIFRLPAINITAGARYDYHNVFGSALVPRIGLTKTFNKAHIKILFSQAFRTPTIGNYVNSIDVDNPGEVISIDSTMKYFAWVSDWNKEIKPEKSTVYELELGYRINDKIQLSTNFYHIYTKNPIVFYYYQDDFIRQNFGQQAGEWMYSNFDASGSSGMETDLRYKDKWGYLDLNYSFYTVEHVPKVHVYSVRTFEWDINKRVQVANNAQLALPKHKINLNFCYYLDDKISINLNGNIYGARYGYDIDLESGELITIGDQTYKVPTGKLVKYKPQVISNAYLHFQNIFTDGLHLGLGCYNLFDTKYDFLQPYFGRNVPLPSGSREYLIKLSYNLKIKK